ncbi:olfactory receptor 14A16-like, partial [Apteryx mantelli]|uniref:Olfactory receptor 14A16-like n=1 Tax=Apteryx mantelli TaxID=2696672 RepID=A0ABM4F2K0_9AVES
MDPGLLCMLPDSPAKEPAEGSSSQSSQLDIESSIWARSLLWGCNFWGKDKHTVQMRGFSVGGTTEYRTATTRSRVGEESEGGFRQANISVTMNRENTARIQSEDAEKPFYTMSGFHLTESVTVRLHYGTLMGSRACVKMAAAAWGSGFLYSVLHTANTFSIPLCQGNTVDQFFCEIPQILKLSCSDSYLREVGLLVVSACLGFGCFLFIVLSYVQILTAVLRIPSEQGRHKAFSTCLPHLAVFSLFVSTDLFAYLKPPSISSPALDLVVTVLYAVVPP